MMVTVLCSLHPCARPCESGKLIRFRILHTEACAHLRSNWSLTLSKDTPLASMLKAMTSRLSSGCTRGLFITTPPEVLKPV